MPAWLSDHLWRRIQRKFGKKISSDTHPHPPLKVLRQHLLGSLTGRPGRHPSPLSDPGNSLRVPSRLSPHSPAAVVTPRFTNPPFTAHCPTAHLWCKFLTGMVLVWLKDNALAPGETAKPLSWGGTVSDRAACAWAGARVRGILRPGCASDGIRDGEASTETRRSLGRVEPGVPASAE